MNFQTQFCFSRPTILHGRDGLYLSLPSSRVPLVIEDESQPFLFSLIFSMSDCIISGCFFILFTFMQSLTWIHTHICVRVQVNKALLMASEKGLVDKVRQLITSNADVYTRNEVTSTSVRTRNAHTHPRKNTLIDDET